MNSYRLKPRLDLTKTEGNILMTQIRAEKKLYNNRNDFVPTSHRDTSQQGRKIFKNKLYQETLSPSNK